MSNPNFVRTGTGWTSSWNLAPGLVVSFERRASDDNSIWVQIVSPQFKYNIKMRRDQAMSELTQVLNTLRYYHAEGTSK